MGVLIPQVPKPFRIPEVIQKKYDGWVEYFRKLSPRIMVICPGDEKFDLEKLEKQVKELIVDSDVRDYVREVRLVEWPRKEQVAFIVVYDSSLPGHEPTYLTKHCRIFCYGGIAFSPHYFERDEYPNFSLADFSRNALSWKYIAKLIRQEISELQIAINQSPPPPEEKLFSS